MADGQRILELGCGWESLTLFMAARYPRSSVLAVTNSAPQREYVTAAAAERGLGNVRVVVADMNAFEAVESVDRVVSVEMFEHMRNYGLLFERVTHWLRPDGRFFMHTFCHRSTPYEFVDSGPSDWMNRYIFRYGSGDAEQWRQRWRMFFMACAELFGHANGQEWYVTHYLFARRHAP